MRRLVREQSSYEVELAGQEARLRDLLLKRNKGEGRKEGEGRDDGEDGEDENWGYRVKQEVFFPSFLRGEGLQTGNGLG